MYVCIYVQQEIYFSLRNIYFLVIHVNSVIICHFSQNVDFIVLCKVYFIK